MLEKQTVFKKLAEKIKEELGLEVEKLQRTYAGRHMKSNGAFVWFGWLNNHKRIGSTYPATELIKPKYKLVTDESWGDIDIYPEEKDKD